MKERIYCTALLLLMVVYAGHSQDPAFLNFHQNVSLFNPAYAGAAGSQSIGVTYKSQWIDPSDQGYKTMSVLYEESLPCSILDFNVGYMQDVEGSGSLTTNEFGLRVSANLPLLSNPKHQITLRAGAGVSYGFQDIDYSKLIFSDQLDEKYGAIYPTTFSVPDEDYKSSYLQPGIGFVAQMIFNKIRRKEVVVQIGASMHNDLSLESGGSFGYGKSILGLLPGQTPRLTVHGDVEFTPVRTQNGFLTVRPMLLFENQTSIQYWVYGVEMGLTEMMKLGIHVHSQHSLYASGDDTNWLGVSGQFRPYIGDNRLDLNINYGFNISGLKNTVGPLLEFGIRYHFPSSIVCAAIGRGDEVNYGNGVYKCPFASISPKHKKIYENIWYKE